MANSTDGNDPAFATPDLHNQNGLTYMGSPGLTKREYFATMTMQALIPVMQNGFLYDKHDVAESSVNYADALIEALNKEK
jgi:hypothetical protein